MRPDEADSLGKSQSTTMNNPAKGGSEPLIHAPEQGWRSTLPDLVGCALALLLAWYLGWRTADLIWSLWLASLVIGYALILWKIFGTSLMILIRHGGELREALAESPRDWLGLALVLFGQLFLLAFFTVHFGGFHWGHSMFLSSFFPLDPTAQDSGFEMALADYFEIVRRYAWFLPLAFLAQRDLFRLPETRSKENLERLQALRSGQAPARERSARKASNQSALDMGAAYKGVIRMHLLIFFLFAANALELPDILSYSVVYLTYFFPWSRVIGRQPADKSD